MRPGKPDGPLAALADILLGVRPPRLSGIILALEDVEALSEFHRLVAEYLPDRGEEILAEVGVVAQVAVFAKAFEERYFPLNDWVEAGDMESLGDLLHGIPIVVSGWEYDDYHSLPDQPLPVILASLVVDFEEEMGLEGDGIRIPSLEAAAKKVPVELLDRLPFRGYPLAFLRQVLPETHHEGLLNHALMLCHQTGCAFLDATMEDLYSGGLLDWSRENVDWLTDQWEVAEQIWDKMGAFTRWLEEDPEGHFSQLLAFLERKAGGRIVEKSGEPAQQLEFAEGRYEDRAEVGVT